MSATLIKSTFLKRLWLADALWLLLLSGYLLAGVPYLPFYPDETDHLYASNDYATLFIDRNLSAITDSVDESGNFVDQLAYLRHVDGPFLSYLLGLSWHVAGMTRESLPPEPGWDWSASFEDNLALGKRPSDALLFTARYATTLMQSLSTVVLFALSRQFGGRWLAFFVTGMYALNPMILLHTRRAMFEAPLFFFGLLTLLFAALIVRRKMRSERTPAYLWVGLVVAGGFCIASKHTGAAFVGAALGWIFVAGVFKSVWQKRWRGLPRTVLAQGGVVAGGAALTLLVFFLLSPVLWRDPIPHARALFEMRAYLLQLQIADDAPMGEPVALPQRISYAAAFPFSTFPLFEFEAPVSVQEYADYAGSIHFGVFWGDVLGSLLMLAVGAGVVVSVRRVQKGGLEERALYGGLLLWLAVMLALALVSPLTWERYYLPLIPVYLVLAGVGLRAVIERVRGSVRLRLPDVRGVRPVHVMDALWLLALSGYLLAGVPLLPFHPDETEHLYASNDYATLFINRNPAALTPVRDSMGQLANKLSALRLSDGAFLSYLLGLSWHVTGMTRESLPPEPGWDWNADFETNVAQGRRPDDRLLNVARYATTLMLCASVAVLFALTRQLGGRLLAYGATLLYVLNPLILLHARRAMFEAPLFLFGLLTLLFAALIVRRRAAGARPPQGYWIGLVAAGGFAFAAKHTGIAYLVAALGWIFVGDLLLLAREQGRHLARAGASRAAALMGVGALSLAVFFLLSPVFWRDPAREITTLLNLRAYTLQTQIAANPNGEPLALLERLKNAATYPFVQYPQFEFVNDTSVQEYWRYMTSPYSGAHPGTTVGAAGMFLTAVGVATALYRLLRGSAGERAQYAGLFVWLLAMLALALASPLGWERYYLPLIPVYALLLVLGLLGLAKFVLYRLTA